MTDLLINGRLWDDREQIMKKNKELTDIVG